jgi:translation elongation factor aEF-1 beta
MGTALIKIKIMPEGPDTNLEEIENNAEKIILDNQGEKIQKDREPVAFGINSVILNFARDENLDNDEMLDTIRKIEHVTSAEIIDFRRAFG